MSNGEGTREATGEIVSFDPFDALRVRQSDANDASPLSSQYSSRGESELDRYCSANSIMGTPSMSGSLTYNDFTKYELGSMKKLGIGDDDPLENFSLGGRTEMNYKDQRLLTSGVSYSMRDFRAGFGSGNIQNQQNLKYGSSGLRFYDDDNDELTMAMLDVSGSMGFNQLDNDLDRGFVQEDVERSVACKEPNALRGTGDSTETLSSDGSDHAGTTERHLLGNVDGKCSQSAPTFGEGDLSCAVGGEDKFNVFDTPSHMQIGKTEIEGEDNETSSNCQHSEGDDSIYNSGTDDDDKHVFHLPRRINYHQESKAENENPLLINTSVAFGSEDLYDFLLGNEENGQDSQMLDVFHSQKEKTPEVEENQINFGPMSSMGFSSAGQRKEGKDIRDMAIVSENLEEIEHLGGTGEVKDVRDIPAACCQVQGADKMASITENSTDAPADFQNIVKPQQEDVKEICAAQNKVQGAEKLVNCPQTSITKAIEVDLDPLAEEAPQQMGSNATDTGTMEKVNQYVNTEEVNDAQHVDNPELDNSKFKFDKIFDSKFDQNSSSSTKHLGSINPESFENLQQVVPSTSCGIRTALESSPISTNLHEKNLVVPKIENFELNELYDEVVHEMEEILLDSIDSPGARRTQSNRLPELQFCTPSRDGGLTASTSGTHDAYLLVHHPMRFDRIEVVGARQKKGDVSFSERLVGVKEYTVYKIKVWSGKDQWEIERRYRDFLTLYRRVKTIFTEQGWPLPLPWSSVEKESNNVFGSASPDVIVQRSDLMQECLQSILHARFFSSPPSALIWFLSPQDSYPTSPASNALVSQSSITGGTSNRDFSPLGKTISLIVEIPPYKSTKQMLEAQHNTCAGCYKHFDDGKTLIQDFVQTFGWGKPRLCEYTGQLFCSSCHTNETAVLPAKVLHQWDFTQYPVSQLAKSYLDSIHDQPMLCVTAVNPLLFSKVPALLHVISVRKKLGAMLPYVRCPFRRSINRVLGNRRYLLESNDFFALRDLIDLSKGAFAALPVMVETVSRKILEHITDQCLICCDVGVPCSARQDCSDPVSLIFPFQEDEIRRCKTCQSVFHEPCFRKLTNCPCGACLRLDEITSLTNRDGQVGSGAARRTLDYLGRGFLSGLFTKDKPEKTREYKDQNIILMDSLPSTSL